MGVIYRQAVLCITHDEESKVLTELDAFIKQNPLLFAKSETLTNGVINYVMFWDGSKEGWTESNEGDKLRAKFIEIVNRLEWADIYEINDHEEYTPQLKHTCTLGYE